MNCFEFYGITPTLFPDASLIRSRFLENQRQWHPDFHAAVAENHQKALENTAINNTAARILGNTDLRVKHLLELKEVDTTKNVLTPDVLMDLMELQDEIAEVQDSGDAEKAVINSRLEAALDDYTQKLQKLHTQYPQIMEMPDTGWTELLRLYQMRQYLSRLQKNLGGVHEL